ncbi:MAG: tRNA (adenosine(37)-N6)-dimethylallyltransferase MiaA [Bacilli bacterium]
MKKVIVITGPTAIGKTEMSLQIARLYNTEIINADASQFRKGLNVGTAKIDYKNLDVVHHLIDIIDIEEDFSIKDFQDRARDIITSLHNENKIPLIVGGSGLYINSVIGKYELDDSKRDYDFEEKFYESYSNEDLHKELALLDFDSSLNIHPNNRRRVLRAISKAKSGTKISTLKKGQELIYDCLIFELTTSREVLYSRINKRFSQMIEDGWLEEVRDLKNKGYDLEKIKDIGYTELANYLDGVLDFYEVSELIKKKTRNYAKRQITWFKNKMNTTPIEMDYDNLDNTLNNLKLEINKFLKETSQI